MISDSVIQKPESESVQPGRSVTLSCSVHTDRCAAEHTHVLWLKNSDHSAPEMIHSSGNKNDICQKTETGSGEATCVYHLLMRNLSSDDAGTYYCAVTSCGEVLLGKGTKIKMDSKTTMFRSIRCQSKINEKLMITNLITTIHPEGEINIYTKFHGNSFKS